MKSRPRRLRMNATLREILKDTHIVPANLIYPLFLEEGLSGKKPIPSMPGIFRLSATECIKEVKAVYAKGIRSVLLFGIPKKKDARGSGSSNEFGIVQKTVALLKSKFPDLFVITDVCLCEYTSHGHCGLLGAKGKIENDATLEHLARTALSHAEAGADCVAPSDMMDGRVKAIRSRLDDEGFSDLPIMSYAVKYASSFYGPFRDAAGSAPQFGDRKTYQMDFSRHTNEALREAKLDEAEGADFIIVKPAMPYLDVLSKVASQTKLPVVAYQVSGEYSMIQAAAAKGFIDGKRAVAESLISIKRAGATAIITYFAKDYDERDFL